MAMKRPRPEEMVVKLRRVEALMGQSMPRSDAIRQISVTEQPLTAGVQAERKSVRWTVSPPKKDGGMGTEKLRELKQLEKENGRPRRAVSDLMLGRLISREAASGTADPHNAGCHAGVLTKNAWSRTGSS
jgi:hypothetical protein